MRKLIKKYLKKKLETRRPKHYYFLRWLSELVKDEMNTENVLAGIASWMVATGETFLPFNDIFVIDNAIYIYTHRPGLWIGKKDSVINSLEYSLNHNINDEKIHDYKISLIECYMVATTTIESYLHVYKY